MRGCTAGPAAGLGLDGEAAHAPNCNGGLFLAHPSLSPSGPYAHPLHASIDNATSLSSTAEAAEVLFDAGRTDVYSVTREQLSKEQAAARAPPAAAPSPQADAEVAAQFGGGVAGEAEGEAEDERGPSTRAGRLRCHHAPPAAAPAAAAEPAVSPDKPSIPSSERTAATTRGGAGVGAAAHGFAAGVPSDVRAELAATTLPPGEVQAGLGGPTSAPTAEELQGQQQRGSGGVGSGSTSLGFQAAEEARLATASFAEGMAPEQLETAAAAVTAKAEVAIHAALFGSFDEGVPPAQPPAVAAAAAAGTGQVAEPQRLQQEGQPGAPAAATGPQEMKAVAYDNETANLAALPGGATGGWAAGGRPAEE